jgi:CMP-N,N'-diacetyllegionaminic acid synthase
VYRTERKTLAIIPARGGSKRIPQKNVSPLAGIPLIQHTIDQAKHAKSVNRVVVSTDDSEITAIANRCEVEVIQRPLEIASGGATSEEALNHVLNLLKETEAYTPDEIVFLQCTSPLRDPGDIDSAIDKFRKEECDSLFSATRFRKYLWRIDQGVVRSINFSFESERWMEQEFPIQYEENGSIYVIKPWVLDAFNYRFGGKIGIYLMRNISSLQIDEPEDWTICETLIQATDLMPKDGANA